MSDPAKKLEPLELGDEPHLTEDERAEIARLWEDEVRRRSAEIDTGTARLVPADEVLAGLRRLIEERRRS